MKILLIRHGKTYGNTMGRYIGSRTDEPLCDLGISCLEKKEYPKPERVYLSPMKRCRQTVDILWPDCIANESYEEIELLKECDFGDFENKNYKELSGNADYQAWIDSGGILPFPGGESIESFKVRCLDGFNKILEREQNYAGDRCIAIVAHGGTIMAILEAVGTPKKGYFDYQVKNGEGYELTPSEENGLWNYRSLQ